MRKRLTAMMMALLLTAPLAMIPALAETAAEPAPQAVQTPQTTVETAEAAPQTAEETASAEEAGQTPAPENTEVPTVDMEEAAPNMVMFASLAELMRKNGPSYKALSAQMRYIEDTKDYVSDLQRQLAQKSVEVSAASSAVAMDPTNADKKANLARLQGEQMQLQTALTQFSSIAAQDTTQIDAGCDQMVLGCEMAYIQLVDLEIQEDALLRQIAGLERTAEAMQVRLEGGQVSKLQMMELENGLKSARDGLAALRTGKATLQMQIEQMLGEEITATFAVGTLPRVTAEQINALNPEADLANVLRRNPDVKAAEASEDKMLEMGITSMSSAMWDSLSSANTYSVAGAKLQAEAGFRALCRQLKDQQNAVATAKEALETAQLAYDAEALKYDNGTISRHALLTAEDELLTAKEAVEKAENTLFSVYNQYQWAVKRGILM